MAEAEVPMQPAALALMAGGLIITNTDSGQSCLVDLDELIKSDTVEQKLMWASILFQKDLAERVGWLAHSMGQLAQAMQARQAAGPVDIKALMQEAMTQAATLMRQNGMPPGAPA